jgi:UDP:flavonoid glycosyltransferase YjiC (YdhE family)
MYYGKNRFINIPARGRTNPTPALVKELVQRGETVYLQLLQ